MKKLLFLMFIPISLSLSAQDKAVEAKVYTWDKAEIEKKESGERRQILEGMTTDLENLEIHTTTLKVGKKPHKAHTHLDEEELIIIKEGTLKVTIKDESKELGPGSIALMMPGDEHGFENTGKTKATYYVIKYKSIAPMDAERGKKAGGSFMIDWNDIAFKAHDKGGIRQYCNLETTMCKKFEMHVTTLNAGLKSHEPHTHRAAEIVLMIKGNTEMEIGEKIYKGNAGDLYFLSSNISHAIKNIGSEPAMYFAFQFE